jgi:tRNA U34 2-thiouridine synthase MnmA/TrmU
MKKKAVALLSGGLDSTLAMKMILDQGIEVTAVNLTSPFCTCNRKGRCEARYVSDKFNVPMKVFVADQEYLDLIRNPVFGYGKNLNPCLDCRIYLFKKAKQVMEEIGAEFIFTGEVLGQRPMSQRAKTMKLIDREAGVEGKILRPLSARLLNETPMENGIINRDELASIEGRSRKKQMAMAESYGISDYACPAGGCMLTDKQFARKLQDLFDHSDKVTMQDIPLLKVGRHFRLPSGGKVVVGRNEQENKRILSFARDEDLILEMVDIPGPVTIMRGENNEQNRIMSASLTVRYSDLKNGGAGRVLIYRNNVDLKTEINTVKATPQFIESVRI